MAWTTKSSVPQCSRQLLEHRVDRGGVGHVAFADHELRAELRGERLDPLLQRLALIGEGDLGALAACTALAMPQAIERLLATPMTRPRLPAINLPPSAIGLSPRFFVVLAGL